MNFTEYLQQDVEIKKELRLLLRTKKPVIFDVGACEGEETIRYHLLFNDARFFLFEPVRANIARIRSNLDKFGITPEAVYECALSDMKGESFMYMSSGRPESMPVNDWDYGNKSSSLLKPNAILEKSSWMRFENAEKIKCDTIEHVFEEHGLSSIDFIHMDVQGAELLVLKGAGRYLDRIKAIWMEVSKEHNYHGEPDIETVKSFMRRHGFSKMTEVMCRGDGDQLFVNDRYYPRWATRCYFFIDGILYRKIILKIRRKIWLLTHPVLLLGKINKKTSALFRKTSDH